MSPSVTGVFSSPASASSSRLLAASCPSFLFVPMTPLGPRRIQPVTYSPVTWCSPSTTRPATFGIVRAALVE